VKKIPNFDYAVAPDGRVWSYKTNKYLRPSLNHRGYCTINISNKEKKKNFLVHTLVAKLYIPNPKNLPQINHKDSNKQNNCVANLEWCTPLENMAHSFTVGTHKDIRGSKHFRAKLKEEDIPHIKEAYKAGETQTSIANRYGVTNPIISLIVNGKAWTHV